MKKLLVLLAVLFASPVSAQIVNTLPFQLQNGTTADATQVMADFNQIVNNANANAAKNGANSDITSLNGLTTPLTPAQGGSSVYVGGTGSGTNAQVISAVSPNGFTLTAGKRLVYIAGGTNTGATTLAAAGQVATNVYAATPNGPQPLIGGEIKAGNIVEVWFDGTQFQLITNNLALLGPLNNLASATITDLGTVPTHNVNITGTTTITSFGATASVTYPIYYLTFAGITTLTYNQTSCSTTGNCINMPGAASITTAAGDTAVAQYLGAGSGGGGNWLIWSYQRASGTSVVAATPLCGATNLLVLNNTGTPNTNVDYSADSAVMVSAGGASIAATAVSGTVNTTNVGVINGIQATRVLGTWYNIYFLSNGVTTGAFAVASGTGLSAPSGYIYSCRLAAMRTDGSANFLKTRQSGAWAQYQAFQQMASGSSGSLSAPTFTTQSVSNYIPPTANQIHVNIHVTGGDGGIMVAPNSGYGAQSSSGSPFLGVRTGAASCGSCDTSITDWMVLEGTSIFWASNSGAAYLNAVGWKDAVNAN